MVTGGAGYIGSHTVKKLLEKKYKIIVLDNLSTGFIKPIELLQKRFKDLKFINSDLKDKNNLNRIFKDNKINLVIHLAAKVSVSESVEKPDLYYQENYINSINLVESMIANGINKLVFSSSCVVYGTPKYIPIDEKHPLNPQSPYGKTKLDFENYIRTIKNIDHIIYRFFNVGGSDSEEILGKSNIAREDLISNIVKVALNQQKKLEIYGNDYETRDGTAVRDYIHVEDIATAILIAVEKINKIKNEIFNLGSEKGFTVNEVYKEACKVTGRKLPFVFFPRRKGDIPVSVASSEKAKEILGWKPVNSTVTKIITTDLEWRKKNPFGY